MKYLYNVSLLWLIIVLSALTRLEAQVVCTYTAVNDLCQNAQPISNIPFSTSSCCGNIEGVNLCNLTETGVWYYYNQSLSASLIEIENLSISGAINVEFYSGTCGNLTLISRSDCSGFQDRTFEVPNCSGVVYIHISTTENGCGEFSISASDLAGCEFADECMDISTPQIMNPVADGAQVCVSSCLDYSCLSTCTDKSVWFRFDTDELTTAVSIIINNADFAPLVSIYRGVSCLDFDDLMICESVNPGEFIDLDVTPDFTYYIELSLESGNPGSFDICINAIQDFIECSSGELTVTRIENPGADPDGPFCPGETVLFCYDLEFYVDTPAEGNGCQWLQGIVPILGGGWNLSANNPESQSPTNWFWFDDVDYNVDSPVLGLTTDAGGKTILEYGPGGLQSGDILPGGWYFVSNGTNAGCTNDGHPDNMWGVSTPCGQVFTFSHCFELTARSVSDIQDCEDNYIKDLSVTLFNFADGETGCYTSLACSGDTPVRFEGQLDCSSLVDIEATGDEICSGDYAEIPVSVVGGYEIPLQVEVLDAGNTSGAQDWIFESGSGLIPDQIINLGNDIETITYQVSFYEPETDCNTPSVTFDVLVYPEFSFDIEDYHLICEGESQLMSAPAGHDDYAWYDAETNRFLTDSRHLNVDSAGYYRIEVTEDLCTATRIVEVAQNPLLEEAIAIEEINVCNNYIGTLPTVVDLTQFQLNGIEGDWYDENGQLIADPSTADFTGRMASVLDYSFETTSALPPCPNDSYDVDIVIEACTCPEIIIISPGDFCALDQTFDLNNINATIDEGSWTLSGGPSMNGINLSGTDLEITDNVIEGRYYLTFSLDDPMLAPLCRRDSTVDFYIFHEPDADIQPSGSACNIYTGTDPDMIDLDDFNLSSDSGVWTSNDSQAIIAADNTVDFSGMNPGSYAFYFTTDSAQPPCIDQQYTTVIDLADCSCPDVTLVPIDDRCIDDFTLNLSEYRLTTEPGSWMIVSGPDVGSVSLAGEALEINSSTTEGTYTLRYVLDDTDIGPLCDSYSEIGLTLYTPVSASIVPAYELCNTYTGTLETSVDLDVLINTSNEGSWISSDGSITINADNEVGFDGLTEGDYEFTFITNDAQAPCTDESYSTIITIQDCSCPEVGLTAIPDLCIEDTDIELSNFLSSTEPGSWSIVSGPDAASLNLSSGRLGIDDSTVAGDYTIRYTLDDTDIGPLCDSYAETALKLVAPVNPDIQSNAELCNSFTGTLGTGMDLDDLLVYSGTGQWRAVDGNVFIDPDNGVDFEGMTPGDYRFEFETNDAELPCPNEILETTITVRDCSCPSVTIGSLNDICIEPMTIQLNDIRITTEAGQWSVVSGPEVNSLSLTGSMLEINDMTIPGSYTLRYTIFNPDIPPLCDSYSETVLTLVSPVDPLVQSTAELCNSYTGTLGTSIDLDDLLVYNGSGLWRSLDGNVTIDPDNQVDFEGMSPGDYVFEFETTDATAPCLDKTLMTTITLSDCSCPSVALDDLPDYCIEPMNIELNTILLTGEAGQWTVVEGADPNSIILNGSVLEIDDQSVAGSYTLRYTIINPDVPPLCATFGEVTFGLSQPADLQAGPETERCNIFTGTLDDFIDLDDLIITSNQGNWESLDNTIIIDQDNNVSFTGLNPGSYTFRFTTNDVQLPCSDASLEVEVIVTDCRCPDVTLEDIPDQCIADASIALNDYVLTSEPGQWTVINGPDISTIEIQGEDLNITTNTEAGVYTLRYTLDNQDIGPLCDGFSEIELSLLAEPSANIIEQGEACNEDTGTLPDFVDLDDYNPDGAEGIWTSSDPAVEIDGDNIVTFTSKEIKEYIFSFSTNTAELPCEDQQYQLVIDLMDCSCPDIGVSPLGDLCLEEQSIDLNDLKLTTEPGSWSLTAGPDLNGLDIVGSRLEIGPSASGGLYTLSFQLSDTDDVGPDCALASSIDFQIVEPPSADIVSQAVACNEDTGAESPLIDLDTMNPGSSPGEWRTTHSGLTIDTDNSVSFEGVEPGAYEFIFTTDAAVAPCDEVEYTLTVNVKDCSCPAIVIAEPQDFCQEETIFELANLVIDAEAGTWSMVAGSGNLPVIQGNNLIITEQTQPGLYELVYSLDAQNLPPDCQESVTVDFNVNPVPTAEIIESAVLCDNYIGSLETSLDLDDYFVSGSSGSWIAADANVVINADNTIEMEGFEPGQYSFVYRTDTALAPCENETYELVLDLGPIADLCSDQGTLDISSLLQADNAGSWSVVPPGSDAFIEVSPSNVVSISDEIPEGSYALVFTFDDQNLPSLCQTEVRADFEIINPPAIELIPNFLACNAPDSGFAPVEIDLDDFITGATGSWQQLGGAPAMDGDNRVSFDGVQPGNYIYEFTTDAAQAPCNDVTGQLDVTVENCICPVIAFMPSPDLCNEDAPFDLQSLVLNGVEAGEWTQTDGPQILDLTNGVIDINGAAEGEYSFMYTLTEAVPSGCPDSEVIDLQINPASFVDVVPYIELCNQYSSIAPECIDLSAFVMGDAGIWEAPGNYNGDFSDPANVCFSGFEAGERYIFRYTSQTAQDPCEDKSGDLEVYVLDCSCPDLSLLTAPAYCNATIDPVDLNDFLTEETVEGNWVFGGGPNQLEVSGSEIDIEGAVPGSYIFEYIPLDSPASTCPQSNDLVILISDYMSAGNGVFFEICEGDMMTLDLFEELGDADEGGIWQDISPVAIPDEALDLDNAVFNTGSLPVGDYELLYTVQPDAPCPQDEAVISLRVHALPVADAGEDMSLDCSVTSVQLGGQGMSSGTNITYEWTELGSGLALTANVSDPAVSQPGTYQVVVTDRTTQCMAIDEVTVVDNTATVGFTAEVQDFDCADPGAGTITVFDQNGGDGNYLYSIDNGSSWTDEAFFDDLSPGSYTVLMEDGNGCRAEQTGLRIYGPVSLNVWLGDDVEIEYGDELYPLQLMTDASDEEIDTIIWEMDGEVICEGGIDDCFDVEVDVFQEAEICVFVTDVNGCSDSDCIIIEEKLEVKVYMANVFTPLSYDYNSRFFVQTNENVKLVTSFRIFDRWGGIVFEGREEHEPNKSEEGWDGTRNKRDVLTGVYTYHVVVEDIFGESHSFGGEVTLIR